MRNDVNTQLAGAGVIIIVTAIMSMFIGAFTWPYAINTWLVAVGREATCVWWQGALIGLVPIVGRLGIVAALITWVFMLFM